jgi:DegV family protein with EDD domain
MTQKVAIITDSSACIPGELLRKYRIGLVPLNVIIGRKTYQDGVDITPTKFYALLRETEELPTTSHSSPGAHLEAYRRASRIAPGILCITISSSFSGQFSSAQVAKELAGESLPGVAIEVFDCGTAAAAQGMVVLAAARAAAAGQSLDEVLARAKSVAGRVHLIAMVDSLNYLVRGGHVPKAAAWASSLFKIKPLLTLDDGDARLLANTRTTPRAMARMLKIMKQMVIKGLPLRVAVMHADALKNAELLKEQIASRFDCSELFITEFTPVMGAHIGPGLIGVAFCSGD